MFQTFEQARPYVNEALHALEADRSFLLQGQVFSEELIRQWMAHTMEPV
ncbi:MAG: hypothetical protein ACOYZ7_01400 [Chloroflexota bacterium]